MQPPVPIRIQAQTQKVSTCTARIETFQLMPRKNSRRRTPIERTRGSRRGARRGIAIGDSDLATLDRSNSPAEDDQDLDAEYPDTVSIINEEDFDSISTNDGSTTHVPTGKTLKRVDKPQVIYDAEFHGPPPPGLTAEKFMADHKEARENGQRTRDMLRGTGGMTSLNETNRGRVAHAILM